MIRPMIVFGTRPEVVKLGPVIETLKADPAFQPLVVATGQHREMLAQALDVFGIVPDVSLEIMQPDQDLFDVTIRALDELKRLLRDRRPDLLLVQGDTTTAFAATLAAFYCRIPVGHVEAGLRSFDRFNPYPEEVNRKMVATMAEWHFAPTSQAHANLVAEGVPASRIFVTGNTVIDALMRMRSRMRDSLPDRLGAMGLGSLAGRLLLVTCHRRESFGPDLEAICEAIRQIVDAHPDVTVVYPVHANPNVRRTVEAALGAVPRVVLMAPVDYVSFMALMERAYLILTDSGGVQEEAPTFQKPVLVLRKTTERPEGIKAGVARLVGADVATIVAETARLLGDEAEYGRVRALENPYGDGRAAERMVAVLKQAFSRYN